MEVGNITKLDGARRQLDTAIDLFFGSGDSLSTHTLAWSAFKVLMDLYPKRREDDFAATLDTMITKEGWKHMSGVANFLKHADKDADAFLEAHHPMQAMAIIGLATLLYRRLAGDFSLKMMAMDAWVEFTAADELGIEEVDTNAERVAAEQAWRERVNAMPFEEYMVAAKAYYDNFVKNFHERLALVEKAQAEGKSYSDFIDGLISSR